MNKEEQSPVRGFLGDFCRLFEAAPSYPHPADNSPLNVEMQFFPRPESVRTAYSLAGVVIESAADYLKALDSLVRAKDYAVAPWTCARGVLEGVALATWLLDKDIDAKERVSRSLSIRFTTLRQQEKMARSDGDNTNVRKCQDRIKEIEDVAVNLGFSPLRNNRGRRTCIAQSLPPITELIRRQIDKEGLYRVLSGLAHSDYVSIMQLASAPIDYGQCQDNVMGLAIHHNRLDILLADTAAIFARGVWLRTIQFGCDAAEAAIILETRYNELELPDTNEVRFWRTVITGSS